MADTADKGGNILATSNCLQVSKLIFQKLLYIIHRFDHLVALFVFSNLEACSLPSLLDLSKLLLVLMFLVGLIANFCDFFWETRKIQSEYLLQSHAFNAGFEPDACFFHQFLPVSVSDGSSLELLD